MSDTETIASVYGEVEVETVDCDHCGQALIREDAVPVAVGGDTEASVGPTVTMDAGEPHALCEYCAASIFDYSGESGVVAQQSSAIQRVFAAIPWPQLIKLVIWVLGVVAVVWSGLVILGIVEAVS